MEKKTETEETVTPRSLETVRLLIRPFQEEDADAFFACCQNPNLGNNAGWAPHKTIEESRKILQDVFIGQENIWAIQNATGGALWENRILPVLPWRTGTYA